MSARPVDDAFAPVATGLVRDRRVSRSEKKGFGSSGLWAGGKLFAFPSSKGALVVKLPRQRVDALVASGTGKRFDPGQGRLMKEWLAVPPAKRRSWTALAAEALAYAVAQSEASRSG